MLVPDAPAVMIIFLHNVVAFSSKFTREVKEAVCPEMCAHCSGFLILAVLKRSAPGSYI